MKYRVHPMDVRLQDDQVRLEHFLNRLEGEVVSIIPNVRPAFMAMGATARINFLYITKKIIQ